MTRFNLILIGGLQDNALTARIVPKLPIVINNKNELIAAGRKPISLKNAGLRIAYYNPLAPKRLIFLVATDERGEKADKWLMNVRRLLTGASGSNRVDSPDMIVSTFDGLDRCRMQFAHGWQWRQIKNGTTRFPEKIASMKEMNLARLRVMKRATGADYAFWRGMKNDRREFDVSTYTLADMACYRTPGQSLLCTMTGKELVQIQQQWLSKGELLVQPVYKAKDIDLERDYKIVMPPWLCGYFARVRRRNLDNVEAGPVWRQQDLWREIMKR